MLFRSGGGALLEGLPDKLSETLHLHVTIGENPQDDVAVGAGIVAGNDRLADKLLQSGCLIEA